MAKVLYLSLTGMTEPLGRSQVLEYLIELSKKNTICLLSYERETDLSNLEEIERLTKRHGIIWHWLPYTNRHGVFSTLKQLVSGMRIGSKMMQEHNIDIIHARSFIPAVLGVLLKKRYNAKLLFDIRGFAVDEMVDRNRISKRSLLYKTLRRIEDRIYRNADHVVTLTHKAKAMLGGIFKNGERITVIPTCANKELFKPLQEREKKAFRQSLGFQDSDKIIIHTGTVGTWYDFDSEVKLVKAVMERDGTVRFLILNKNEQPFIHRTLEKYGLPMERVTVDSCAFEAMNRYLNIADISIFFIKPSYSKQASAPTKFAENVACRLPSVTNRGVGDMEYYLTRYPVGRLVDLEYLDETVGEAAEAVLQAMREERKDTAGFDRLFEAHFDKDIAVKKYQEIYSSLGEPSA